MLIANLDLFFATMVAPLSIKQPLYLVVVSRALVAEAVILLTLAITDANSDLKVETSVQEEARDEEEHRLEAQDEEEHQSEDVDGAQQLGVLGLQRECSSITSKFLSPSRLPSILSTTMAFRRRSRRSSSRVA